MEENRTVVGGVPEEKIAVETDENYNIILETAPLEGGEENAAQGEEESEDDFSEREQYDALMKGRFKNFYAEDTQRLINRRFRKYKVMEERFKLLEESLAQKEAKLAENAEKIAEFEAVLRAEIEKAVKETEERVIGEIRAKKLRPFENGTVPQRAPAPFDVSKLSRDERAKIAKRAAGGERIKF